MPFITLNNGWSNLAVYYNTNNNNGSFIGGKNNPNVTNSPKPQIPTNGNQFKLFDDGLIRGGILNTALATKNDLVRISNFLYKSDKGPLFIVKQIGLHLSNPLLEQKANKTVTTDAAGNKITTYVDRKDKLGLLPTRIYNGGINTLLSVGGNAFGIHFPKFGLLPTANYNYEKIATENNLNTLDNITSSPIQPPAFNTLSNNSQSSLETSIITGISKKSTTKIPSPYTNKPNRLVSYLGKITENRDSTNPVVLQSYLGGPDSVYGLVRTRILTTGNSVTNKSDYTRINGFKPRSYKSLYDIGTLLRQSDNESHISYYYGPAEISSTSTTFQATGNTIREEFGDGLFTDTPVIEEVNTITKNIVDNKAYIPLEYSYGVSRARNKNINESSVDSINALNITDSKTFYDNINNTIANVKAKAQAPLIGSDNVNENSTYGKDIIKFRIEILNNNQITSGGVINTEVFAFRAYLNEFNDGIDAKWNPYRYMGRGEEFYVYEGFTRDINVGFTIFAHSKGEMKPLYQKLNNLISSFTPDYSSANLMRGNIGYLTVGDYLYRVPGVFTSMKINNLLDAHWETNLDGDMYELPKFMNIVLSFKPIHSFVPRRNYAGKETAAFITPDVNTYSDLGIAFTEKIDDSEKLINRFIPSIQRTVTTN